MDREKHAFFTAVQEMEKRSKDKRMADIEEQRSHLLKSVRGGFSRNKNKTISLPKLSIQEKE